MAKSSKKSMVKKSPKAKKTTKRRTAPPQGFRDKVGAQIRDFYFGSSRNKYPLRKGRFLTTFGVLGTIALGAGLYLGNKHAEETKGEGELVYQGTLDGFGDVVYRKGVGSPGDEKNILYVINGEKEYTLVDRDANPFDRDKIPRGDLNFDVEEFTYQDSHGRKFYRKIPSQDRSYLGNNLSLIFEHCDNYYNEALEKIRSEKSYCPDDSQ